jgi:hypothetical protein
LCDLPSSSVDCLVTSPPYFAVRDYGHDQQLGLEASVDQWVSELRAVLAEVGRVLRPSGALWLNLRDGYSLRQAEGAPRKSLLLALERLVPGARRRRLVPPEQGDLVQDQPHAEPGARPPDVHLRGRLLFTRSPR